MAFSQLAQAQANRDIDIEQLRRTQEREAAQRKQRETEPDVHLQQAAPAAAALPLKDESPCFPIKRIEIDGSEAARFAWLLDYADGHAQLPQADPVVGRCLGVQGIQIVIDRMQNALISRGFVTSRVLAGPQNLQGGALVLTVVPGRVAQVRWAPETAGTRCQLPAAICSICVISSRHWKTSSAFLPRKPISRSCRAASLAPATW
jgi:hemolysin activation/secretion protein